ncbi:MAG TPA: GNAT family N-acetyltransferase [Methanobacteriaceae archaeon]|nr:GNAT family N-acetyltransferase [Methanobacteriaceae archaeon]
MFIETGAEDLDLIQPLWEKLNEHHQNKKSDFQDHYENFTFQERKEALIEKAHGGFMRIDLVKDEKSNIYVGYCITTISPEHEGEVDSIYVEKKCRSRGIGDQLMKRSLAWMERKDVKTKEVAVAIGNQEAISFYERYGFRPRIIILKQVNQSDKRRIEFESKEFR